MKKKIVIVLTAGFKNEVSPTFKMHYRKYLPQCESAGKCLNGS